MENRSVRETPNRYRTAVLLNTSRREAAAGDAAIAVTTAAACANDAIASFRLKTFRGRCVHSFPLLCSLSYIDMKTIAIPTTMNMSQLCWNVSNQPQMKNITSPIIATTGM